MFGFKKCLYTPVGRSSFWFARVIICHKFYSLLLFVFDDTLLGASSADDDDDDANNDYGTKEPPTAPPIPSNPAVTYR